MFSEEVRFITYATVLGPAVLPVGAGRGHQLAPVISHALCMLSTLLTVRSGHISHSLKFIPISLYPSSREFVSLICYWLLEAWQFSLCSFNTYWWVSWTIMYSQKSLQYLKGISLYLLVPNMGGLCTTTDSSRYQKGLGGAYFQN